MKARQRTAAGAQQRYVSLLTPVVAYCPAGPMSVMVSERTHNAPRFQTAISSLKYCSLRCRAA